MLAVMFSLFKNFFNVFGYDVAIFTLFKSFIELKLNLLGTDEELSKNIDKMNSLINKLPRFSDSYK